MAGFSNRVETVPIGGHGLGHGSIAASAACLRSTRTALDTVSMDSVYGRAGTPGVPVLLIWGKEDKTVPIEQAEIVRRAIPSAQYHPIDSAAHLPHMERGDVVNPLLIGFLRSARAGDSTATVVRGA